MDRYPLGKETRKICYRDRSPAHVTEQTSSYPFTWTNLIREHTQLWCCGGHFCNKGTKTISATALNFQSLKTGNFMIHCFILSYSTASRMPSELRFLKRQSLLLSALLITCLKTACPFAPKSLSTMLMAISVFLRLQAGKVMPKIPCIYI